MSQYNISRVLDSVSVQDGGLDRVVVLRYLLLLVVTISVLDGVATPTTSAFVFSGHFLVNAMPVMLVFAALVAVTQRAGFSAIVTVIFVSAFYLFNILKLIYWDTVIVPSDLHLLLALDDVARTVADTLGVQGVLLAATVLGCLIAVCLAAWRRSRKSAAISLRARATICSFVALVSAALYLARDRAEPVLTHIGMTQKIWQIELQLEYGLFSHLYLTSALNGLNNSMFEGDPNRVVAYASSLDNSSVGATGPLPDIVVLLAESLFDPATLKSGLLRDPLAVLRNIEPGVSASGSTRVHSAGGGTWMSEHSFVTGIPGPEFGSTGRWPFALADENSWTIAKALQQWGYRTVLLYPAEDDYIFNSRRVYQELGFDRYYDISDIEEQFGPGDGTVDGRILNATNMILNEEQGPVFVFALSLDLHQPYHGTPGPARFLDESVHAPELEIYLQRASVFAGKVYGFLQHHNPGSGRLLFAMFGDHTPQLNRQVEALGFQEGQTDPLYTTPYLIYSNYKSVDVELPLIDLSYLAGVVLEEAGLDGGRFFRVNAAMRELCRGRFTDCDADPELIVSYHAYLGENMVVSPRPRIGK